MVLRTLCSSKVTPPDLTIARVTWQTVHVRGYARGDNNMSGLQRCNITFIANGYRVWLIGWHWPRRCQNKIVPIRSNGYKKKKKKKFVYLQWIWQAKLMWITLFANKTSPNIQKWMSPKIQDYIWSCRCRNVR